MILAKITLIALTSFVFLSLFRLEFNELMRIREKIFLLIVFVFSVVLICFPILLTSIATFLGIGRGTDFLIYIFILLSLWGSVRNHLRINLMHRHIAKIVMYLSLPSQKGH